MVMSPATNIAFSWKSGVFNQELMVPAHRVGWHQAAGILKLLLSKHLAASLLGAEGPPEILC